MDEDNPITQAPAETASDELMAERERLDWLLTLIWDTGREGEWAGLAARRFARLRRRLHDDAFPFRGAIDAEMKGGH